MTYGFIGTGNMGGALARALVKTVSPTDIFLNNRTMARAEALAAELGAHCADAETIASSCGCIFLGVKPHLLPGVLAQLRPTLTAREDKPLLVSMAAGVTIAAIEQAVPGSAVVRIMPNTACAVGAGLTLYDTNSAVTQQQLDALLRDMAASGRLEALPEELIDAGSAVAGCGGAFACLFMEALADGAGDGRPVRSWDVTAIDSRARCRCRRRIALADLRSPFLIARTRSRWSERNRSMIGVNTMTFTLTQPVR